MTANRLVCTLILIVLPLGLGAQSASELSVIGFSPEGRYLAWEESGRDPDTGMAFSTVYLVDVDANDFAEEELTTERAVSGSAAKMAALRAATRRKAEPLLERYRIVEGNLGTVVHRQSRPDSTLKSLSFAAKTPTGESRRFQLVLEEMAAPTEFRERCAKLLPVPMAPRIFTVALRGDGLSRKILQRDRLLYGSRGCPLQYGLRDVYVHQGRVAIFLYNFTRGVRPTVRTLVVSGTLELPKPEAAPLGLEAQESDPHYAVKSETLFADGAILVRLVSDSSTLEPDGGASFRKLVTIDTRTGRQALEAIVLPPEGPFPEFPYYAGVLHDGERKLLVIQGFHFFRVYDVLERRLSEPAHPARGETVIGEDGRSGSLVELTLSRDGRTLTGFVVSSGEFVYDVSEPMNPRKVAYRSSVE